MRRADFRLEIVLCERRLDPRNKIAAISLVIRALKLTSPTFGKLGTWGCLMMRSRNEQAFVVQRVARNSERHMFA